MTTLIESVASQLRAAAEQVDDSAMQDGNGDLYDEGDGRVTVSVEALVKLRHALNRCLGKPEFYSDPKGVEHKRVSAA